MQRQVTLGKLSFLRAVRGPAGSDPQPSEAIASVGSWSFILARPSLPEDIAVRLARALRWNEAALATQQPQARETTAASTVAAGPRADLIHPRVLRYLREIGLAP